MNDELEYCKPTIEVVVIEVESTVMQTSYSVENPDGATDHTEAYSFRRRSLIDSK